MPERRRGASFAGAVLALGVVASILASLSVAKDNAAEIDQWLADRGEVVQTTTEGTVRTAVDGLIALAAFFENSRSVTPAEFEGFVESLDPVMGLIGIGYVTVVPADELDAQMARMQEKVPGYSVTSFDSFGVSQPVSRDREVYYPVELIHSGPLVMASMPNLEADVAALSFGYDVGSPAEWRRSLEYSVAADTSAISAFIEVGAGETLVGNAFIVSVPVHSDEGVVVGLMVAPMVDFLLATEVDFAITESVSWTITSGDPAEGADDLSWQRPIELPGIVWNLVVTPNDDSLVGLGQTSPWLILLTGLILTGLSAYVVVVTSERSRARGEIDELGRVGQEKDRFLAAVSHEIRTPLTVVSGLAHELRDHSQDFQPAEVEELLSMMARQSDEVASIVEDLLVGARADLGKVAIEPQLVDLEHAVTVVLEGTGVEAEVIGSAVGAWADPNRVRQILRNLVSNANRYGGSDRKIALGFEEAWAWVDVMDSGPPISMEDRSKMFDAYVSSSAVSAPGAEAIGLGLFISHRLAVLLGGRLTYRHDGSYSIFRLLLPATEQAAALESAV